MNNIITRGLGIGGNLILRGYASSGSASVVYPDGQARPIYKLSDSLPFDSKDLPRFGQLQETAKDVIVEELTNFFDNSDTDSYFKIKELPNIQKFSFGSDEGFKGLETVVNLIMAYGDTIDKFPMISITSTSSTERKMNLGTNFVSQVQYPARIVGTKQGPFDLSNLEDLSSLQILTIPNREDAVYSTVQISTSQLGDLSSVSAETLVNYINKTQALFYTFSESHDGFLAIEAGGSAAPYENNSIELVAGSEGLLELLGFTIGQSDSFTSLDNPLKNRYGLAADMVINIDVICDSLNTRTELSDLVYSFFGYYLQKKLFQFYGRSYFDRTLENEWYHIVLKNQFSWNGEINKPRQGGEQYEHVYAIRGSLPIFIEDFIDKDVSGDPINISNIKHSMLSEFDISGDF